MAYIDSELAKRRFMDGGVKSSPDSTRLRGRKEVMTDVRRGSEKDVDVHKQPAALGKLQEIDLGDEVRSRNVELTDRARRRLDGEDVEDENELGQGKSRKARLGRDGKPWRSRKRRGSDDVKRDKLVEEILRENRRKSPRSGFRF